MFQITEISNVLKYPEYQIPKPRKYSSTQSTLFPEFHKNSSTQSIKFLNLRSRYVSNVPISRNL